VKRVCATVSTLELIALRQERLCAAPITATEAGVLTIHRLLQQLRKLQQTLSFGVGSTPQPRHGLKVKTCVETNQRNRRSECGQKELESDITPRNNGLSLPQHGNWLDCANSWM
jgi:hypothetical protein